MALSTQALAELDAQLDSLGDGLDLSSIAARARRALDAAGLDHDGLTRALDALGPAAEIFPLARRASADADAEPADVVGPATEPPPALEAAPASEPPPALEAAPASEPPPALEAALASEPPFAEAAAPIELELPADDDADLDILNPFEDEPLPIGFDDDDEPTMMGDLDEIVGLDMDALFDGMVEEALSSPIDGFEASLSKNRPSSLPPPIPADARGLSASESQRPPSMPPSDASDPSGEKKGFFKKLFS